jgi:hypothetical protein
MKRPRLPTLGRFLVLAIVLGGWLFPAVSAWAQEDIRCLTCHGKIDFKKTMPSGKVLELFVDPMRLRLSVHKERKCVDCHADVTEVPHPALPQKVNCRRCHFMGNEVGAPQLEKYQEFGSSVHGKALAAGNPKAPVCQDCHGDHFILPGSDPRSQVSHKNIPQTCGGCHLEIYAQYQESVHGTALAKGVKEAPVCTDCHGEHAIQNPKERTSTVSAGMVVNTCSKCHAKVVIMEKYGVKAEQVATYRESFHGIANEFGMLKAANCASCHTGHQIYPESDLRSTVNPKNIPTTCGKCHPGANANFAKGRIHLNPKDRSAGVVYWVAWGFKILTLSTLAALLIHIALDLFRRVKDRNQTGAPKEEEVSKTAL